MDGYPPIMDIHDLMEFNKNHVPGEGVAWLISHEILYGYPYSYWEELNPPYKSHCQ